MLIRHWRGDNVTTFKQLVRANTRWWLFAYGLLPASASCIGTHVRPVEVVPTGTYRSPCIAEISETNRKADACTGVFTTGNVVLTARHCASEDAAYVAPLCEGRGPSLPERVEVLVVGDSRDVAAYRFLDALPSVVAVSPEQNDGALETASFYVGTRGGGMFSASRVKHDSSHIYVTSPSAQLCYGDSGSPLFIVQSQRFELVGIMDVGALDCDPNGVYRFVRIDNYQKVQNLWPAID